MALSTSYFTVDGQILGEETGGAYTGYMPDALGSVVATVDEDGAIQNTYRYKPYGELLARTGGEADPSFCWVGIAGYRVGINDCTYIRFRSYDSRSSQWVSVDHLWPAEAAYRYAYGSPALRVDPLGLTPETIDAGDYWNVFIRNDVYGCPSCYYSEPGHPCLKNPCGYKDLGGSDQAWVVCCMERSYVCLRDGGKDWDPIRAECAKIHESLHARQGSCRGKCYDRLRFDSVGNDDPNFGECASYIAELRCITSKLRKKCGDPPSRNSDAWKNWQKCAGASYLALVDACDNGYDFCRYAGYWRWYIRICKEFGHRF